MSTEVTGEDVEALEVFNANAFAKPGSFMHALHEVDYFDEAACNQLLDAMGRLSRMPVNIRGQDAHHLAARIISKILLHVIYHLNANDGSRIRDFPDDSLYDWLHRISRAFDPVIFCVRSA